MGEGRVNAGGRHHSWCGLYGCVWVYMVWVILVCMGASVSVSLLPETMSEEDQARVVLVYLSSSIHYVWQAT